MRDHDAITGAGASFLRWLALIEDAILATLLGAMILIAALQILLRNLFDIGLTWGDPSLRVLVLWVGLMGAVTASRDNKHINIDLLLRFFVPRVRALIQSLIGIFTALVCGVIAYHAGRFVAIDWKAGTAAFGGLPAWILELILPVGFALILLRYVGFTISKFREYRRGEDRI